MKLGELLVRKDPFTEIMMSNYALVRAMIECNTKVITSYPGSPLPEIANAISSIKKEERPFYFEYSVNEKVATEVACGASVNGNLSTVFFKSVGLNVAADSFVQLSMMELIGGMVIVLGDDPGANSSQNEQDNRHYSYMSYIPIFEPSDTQEVYDMYKECVKISLKYKMPVILRLTTHVCHQKSVVSFSKYKKESFDFISTFNIQNGPYVPVTKAVYPLKRKALEKIEIMKKISDESIFNINNSSENDKGIIVFGLPYLSVLDCIEKKHNIDIFRPGMAYPLPEKKIIDFLKDHKQVKIIEELDDISETYIKRIAFENKIDVEIIGKSDIDDWIGEYTPDKVQSILAHIWPEQFDDNDEDFKITAPDRPAQMCPGCGHRSAFYAIKKALNKDDITVGDIGCHSLGFLPPYKMGQILLSMGHSTSTGSGLSIKNKNRNIIAFLGDSTFFHAGIPGIINAVWNNHNLTLIIMENNTTAMTGHQDLPASGHNFNEISEKINIVNVLESFGIKNIFKVDTYSQKKLTDLVKQSFEYNGIKVIIAKHPCMLKLTKESKRKGFINKRKSKITEKCDLIKECVKEFSCPAIEVYEDKVKINTDLCIGDGSCVQVCPSNAINIVEEDR